MSFLDALWDAYAAHVPYARDFVRLSAGEFRNDHVAFRSLDVAPIVAAFESLGWTRADSYSMDDVHLSALYLRKPGEPRVFVSELRVHELSARAQDLLKRLPRDDAFDGTPQWFRAPAQPLVTESELLELERESQYAAWLMLFGREVNHFTAAVPDVATWQQRMRGAGIPMKDEIEGAPGADLRQTATKAAMRRVQLRDKQRDWPYAYLEIAERNRAFDGFVQKQARQLFEMTRR